MPRLTLGLVVGVFVGITLGAALGIHASEDEAVAAAAEAGVEVQDLRGAMNSTGLDARRYLIVVGELPASPAGPLNATPPGGPATMSLSALERRVDCIIARESRGDARAVNPRSGAAGLGQFLRSTWSTTPYARSSVFDPVANRAAIAWMLSVGRAREFDAVRFYGC